jgi:hypothetical protein
MQQLEHPTIELLLCGDTNTNYLIHNHKKGQLQDLIYVCVCVCIYNLIQITEFPTRTCKTKSS